MKRLFLLVSIVLFVIPAFAAEFEISKNYGQIPLSFESNQGQMDPRVKFVSRGKGYGLFLTTDGAILRLLGPKKTTVQMKIVDGRRNPDIQGVDPTVTKVNYLNGGSPSGWRSDIATYSRVRYDNVYPGIDLAYYGNQQRLEYDFNVSPGAKPE